MDLTQNPTPRHRLVSPLPQRPLGVTNFTDGARVLVAHWPLPPCLRAVSFPANRVCKRDVVVRAYHPSSRRWSEGSRSLPLPTQRGGGQAGLCEGLAQKQPQRGEVMIPNNNRNDRQLTYTSCVTSWAVAHRPSLFEVHRREVSC